MNEAIRFSSEAGVGHIVFDRPKANAYDLAFHEQFIAAIDAADAGDEVRTVIVRSAVPRFFCAGADINAFATSSTDENKRMVNAARTALRKIETSSKPFIALIEGHTLGGGLEIAMACDMRFAAAADYKLGLPETRMGLLPGNGGSQRLPRIVGHDQAMLLLASGESIGPEEALRIGLVTRLFPQEEALQQTEAFARTIVESAPLAVAATKRAVREGMELPLADALALEADLVDELYDSEDAKEGFQAAREKRRPRYTGR
ncbi:MAG: enoyl-CoA hydratase-related protein [Woeseiaceae bacterium]